MRNSVVHALPQCHLWMMPRATYTESPTYTYPRRRAPLLGNVKARRATGHSTGRPPGKSSRACKAETPGTRVHVTKPPSRAGIACGIRSARWWRPAARCCVPSHPHYRRHRTSTSRLASLAPPRRKADPDSSYVATPGATTYPAGGGGQSDGDDSIGGRKYRRVRRRVRRVGRAGA